MITNYQTSLNGATWVDVNTNFTKNNLPDRVPDNLAVIHCSLFNLFNCSVGERSRTFQPEYGSQWKRFLQEPIDQVTAEQMRISMIQAIARWEPRIKLDYSETFIQPDMSLPGYRVRIAGYDIVTHAKLEVNFTENL